MDEQKEDEVEVEACSTTAKFGPVKWRVEDTAILHPPLSSPLATFLSLIFGQRK
jgi:hypothetical protein